MFLSQASSEPAPPIFPPPFFTVLGHRLVRGHIQLVMGVLGSELRALWLFRLLWSLVIDPSLLLVNVRLFLQEQPYQASSSSWPLKSVSLWYSDQPPTCCPPALVCPVSTTTSTSHYTQLLHLLLLISDSGINSCHFSHGFNLLTLVFVSSLPPFPSFTGA